MIDRPLFRALATSVALSAAMALAGCNSDEISLANNAKANKPISERLVAEMQKKDMDPQSPMLVRLFKQEAELEVWKQTRSGQFALLQTYPICRWSGDLGPKTREGDRQAPEGFYSITPAQMNPQSAYYLSFNIGYPNAYDRSLGHTGSQLMVHGDCSSRGCYAMTDEQISDIYTLGRESFFGGQRAFQVQAYPFRMTPVNMAKHRNNPSMPFWKMIKTGYDHFEVTRQEPKVDFCENKYVFDAAAPPNSSKPLAFNASAKCPAYVIPDEIAEPVRQKEQDDDAKLATLIAKGTPVARLNTGIDGGMNKIFASKIPEGQTGLSDGGDGQGLSLAVYSRAPGTIPPTVNPPHAPGADVRTASVEEPQVATPSERLVSANASSDSFFGNLVRKIGIAGAETTASAAPPSKPKIAVAAKPAVQRPAPKAAETKLAATRPPFRPTLSAADASPPAGQPTVAGAQPVVSSNSFDSRFSAFR